jgi:N-acyl-D-amino-acid deacylase
VLARGYGQADVEAGEPVRPDALFRLASLSKPITAAAVLRLAEMGRVGLDDPVLPLLARLGAPADPRLPRVTPRLLLHHTAGWDQARTIDPTYGVGARQAMEAAGLPGPPTCEGAIRFMLGRPLDFDPGARFAYSNFGYCVLARVLEEATGERYEAWVREHVLAPAGITRMRAGRTRLEDRAPDEVRYYDYPGAPPTRSVFDATAAVPAPYGGFALEHRGGQGGWIASAVDFVRFTLALDGTRGPAILTPASAALIEERPAGLRGAAYYGMGWMIRPGESGATWSHTGSVPGAASYVVRMPRGRVWVALFNSRPRDRDGFFAQLDRGMREAARESEWPAYDLFERFR